MNGLTIHTGDARLVLPTLADASVNCCVTSPPYWGLRDYSACGCSQRRHASEAALAMCRTIVPGASGQSSATDPRCKQEPDPDCVMCNGTGKIAGTETQIGLEVTPDAYVAEMVAVFREVRRVLRDDGTLWLNLGDSYARNGGEQGGGNRELMHLEGTQRRMTRVPEGNLLKAKDLCGIPWRVAFALQADGWWLRQEIIWHKPAPMPESVTDRCTKAHEHIFLMAKSERYYFNAAAIAEPITSERPDDWEHIGPSKAHNCGDDLTGGAPGMGGNRQTSKGLHRQKGGVYSPNGTRNRRSVWTVPAQPYKGAHFATFPPKLIEPCILAGCPDGGTVLDPFGGSGTTAHVARTLGRRAVLIELNPEYVKLIKKRNSQQVIL